MTANPDRIEERLEVIAYVHSNNNKSEWATRTPLNIWSLTRCTSRVSFHYIFRNIRKFAQEILRSRSTKIGSHGEDGYTINIHMFMITMFYCFLPFVLFVVLVLPCLRISNDNATPPFLCPPLRRFETFSFVFECMSGKPVIEKMVHVCSKENVDGK